MEEGTGFGTPPADARTYQLEQLHALKCAVDRAWLEAVAAYDREGSWQQDGARSMADWLSYRFAMDSREAAEHVRVARALDELPEVAAAYGRGELSRDQLAHLSSIARPEDDAWWAEAGPQMPVNVLARRARMERRRAQRTQEPEGLERGSLRYWWTQDDTVLRLSGRLPAADGAVVQGMLERYAAPAQTAGAADGSPDGAGSRADASPDVEGAGGELVPFSARCADALVECASLRLGADPDRDRATIVVHADVATLAGVGAGELEGGIAVTAEAVRRLACDARLQAVIETGDGVPVGIGRVSRTVPPAIARLVRHRDGTCVWPGCNRRLWVDCHHITPWQDGGETNVDNLCLLCAVHHRLVHEAGWTISGNPYSGLRFCAPDGRMLAGRPPPLDPRVRERFFVRRDRRRGCRQDPRPLPEEPHLDTRPEEPREPRPDEDDGTGTARPPPAA